MNSWKIGVSVSLPDLRFSGTSGNPERLWDKCRGTSAVLRMVDIVVIVTVIMVIIIDIAVTNCIIVMHIIIFITIIVIIMIIIIRLLHHHLHYSQCVYNCNTVYNCNNYNHTIRITVILLSSLSP